MATDDSGISSPADSLPNVLTISPSTVLTLSPTSAVEAGYKGIQISSHEVVSWFINGVKITIIIDILTFKSSYG